MPSLPNLSPPGNRKYRWYGLIKEGQDDFSGGAFFGQEQVPANGCEDIVNGYVDQDGGIARRGGSQYRGPSVGAPGTLPYWVWDGYLAPGNRTMQLRGGTGSTGVYMLDATESTWIYRSAFAMDRSRPAVLNGLLWGVDGANLVVVPSHNTSPSGSETGTITLTLESAKVTGVGTNFLTVAKPGMTLSVNNAVPQKYFAIQAVNSNTELILAQVWPHATVAGMVSGSGGYDFLSGPSSVSLADPTKTSYQPMLGKSANKMVVAAAAGRILVGYGSRVVFSDADDPSVFETLNYHEIPGSPNVIGLEGLRNDCLVFTTRGLFVIRNLSYDLVDAQGNVQQQLQSLHPDIVLWDEMGLASWQGTVIVPATDGVYLVDGANAPVGLKDEAIITRYRGYVAAGWQLGQATVYENRYVLPVLNGSTWVDTLVCDLRTRSWSRWDGHAGNVAALTRRVGDQPRQPLLLALEANTGTRMLDLSQAFSPSGGVKNDADGTTHQLKVTFRTLTAGTIPVQWRKFRVRFEADDTVFSTHFRSGLVTGTPITSLPIVATETAVPAGSTLLATSSDGLHTQTWVTTALLNVGDVSVAVVSQAPNYAYGTLSTLTGPNANDDPQLQAELATGRPGNPFTLLSTVAPEGETTFNWQISTKTRAIRYRVTSLHAASKFVIRSFESFYRYTGRT